MAHSLTVICYTFEYVFLCISNPNILQNTPSRGHNPLTHQLKLLQRKKSFRFPIYPWPLPFHKNAHHRSILSQTHSFLPLTILGNRLDQIRCSYLYFFLEHRLRMSNSSPLVPKLGLSEKKVDILTRNAKLMPKYNLQKHSFISTFSATLFHSG